MESPKCPAKIPTKNTKVTPNEIPPIRSFPNPRPMADIKDITTTACKAECSINKLYSQSTLFYTKLDCKDMKYIRRLKEKEIKKSGCTLIQSLSFVVDTRIELVLHA